MLVRPLLPLVLLLATAAAADPVLGESLDVGWQGLSAGVTPTLATPGTATFTYPAGAKGWIKHGFRSGHDGARDWSGYTGLMGEIRLGDDRPVEVTVALLPPEARQDDPGVAATVRLAGSGWHTLDLPWSAFTHQRGRTQFLFAVAGLRVGVRPVDGAAAPVALRGFRAVAGAAVALAAEIQGAAAPAGGTVTYPVRVGNPGATPRRIRLQWDRIGWEAMTTRIEPADLVLAPGEQRTVTVTVAIPAIIPPGGREIQTIQAIPEGAGGQARTLAFTTACTLPHPYLLHQAEGWQALRDRVAQQPWAAAALAEKVAAAEGWQVPTVAQAPDNDPGDTYGPSLFATANEKPLMAAATAWQMTREKAHAEKVALFLRRLSSPVDGYPVTFRACNQGFVQEGHFFQHIAMAYDLILDADVLSVADRAQIDRTLRLFLDTVDRENTRGAINNWNLSELCGAFYGALVLQDLAAAERFFAAPGGIKDQLAKGTMDDGWWYECAISYNVWCASEFTQVALAWKPWGVNFLTEQVPASFAREVSLAKPDGTVDLSGGFTGGPAASARPFGMCREIWGPLRRPSRTITDLWNSLLPFVDWRGVMIGVNDSFERKVAGEAFELAYFAFRDPRYAALIPRDGKRDLLYGLPDLPPPDPRLGTASANADNVGLAMLRSQAERPPRERIQAALHFGSHGWAHGHYDRTGLLALMRYGRSFFNPEMIWYGYPGFMYKFFVQTSMTKNMVVVDRKMQEPTESRQILFHAGKALQALVVETVSRWSHPPYGGMVYDYIPVRDFAEKCWLEGRSVPIPAEAPAYGTLTGFTEPVRQRRLLAVTDDYVVLADHLAAEHPHTYDALLQMKGFRGWTGTATKVRHEAQMDPDPRGAAQFITNCDWYRVDTPAHAGFLMRFGPGADNAGTRTAENEDGDLSLEVHPAWPASAAVMIGTQAEAHPVEKQVTWQVRGDGATLAKGRVGTWVLGSSAIDVPVAGCKRLELQTAVGPRKLSTLFWSHARLILADGREVPLPAPTFTNIEQPKISGRDYAGGPITLVGIPDSAAIPAEPAVGTQPGVLSVDLTGLGAVRFTATLAGDFPVGDEAQRRKTLAIRQEGTEARFLTVIEPHEGTPMVRTVTAPDADHLRVELTDGRVQELTLGGFTDSGAPTVEFVERRAGQELRRERAGR